MSKRKPSSESNFMEKWMSRPSLKQAKSDTTTPTQSQTSAASDITETQSSSLVADSRENTATNASAGQIETENSSGRPDPSADARVITSSSYEKYSWIVKVSEGYVCGICQEFGLIGDGDKVWVNKPLPLSASRKLYIKAAKHADSNLAA